jgi:hypothetical protein
MLCCRNGDCGGVDVSPDGPVAPDDEDGGAESDGLASGGGTTGQDSGETSPPSDAPPRPPPADAAADRGPDAGPPKVACPAGTCSGPFNCVAGFCEAAPATCAALKQQLPSAGDGVYWIQLAGRPAQHGYCDMMVPELLCAERGLRRLGRTREGSGQRFSLWSELQPGEQICKIWAVRNQDGYPMDKLFATTPPLPVSTCQALGFKGGDDGLGMVCRFGWDTANGYTDCGFKVTPIFKWGNSCDCSLVNGQRPRRYVREEGVDPQGRGLFEGGVPWNESGTVFGTCRVR